VALCPSAGCSPRGCCCCFRLCPAHPPARPPSAAACCRHLAGRRVPLLECCQGRLCRPQPGYDCGCRPKAADPLKWTAGACPPSGVSPLVVPCRIRKPGAVADYQMGYMKAGVCRFSSVPWGPNGAQMSSVAAFGGTYAMQQICVTDVAKDGCEYAGEREGGGGCCRMPLWRGPACHCGHRCCRALCCRALCCRALCCTAC
jgi:hypothetical protein